jgi:hypothetical protein
VAANTGTSDRQPWHWLQASCSMAIHCHGATCFTSPSVLPPSTTEACTPTRICRYVPNVATVTWDPCHGGSFSWRASYSFVGSDDANVGGVQLTGSGTSTGTATSAVQIAVASLSGASRGIEQLSATCDAWHLPQ